MSLTVQNGKANREDKMAAPQVGISNLAAVGTTEADREDLYQTFRSNR